MGLVLRLGGAIVTLAVLAALAIFLPPAMLQHKSDLPFERQMGHMAVKMAASSMKDAKNPVNNDRRAQEAGLAAYTGQCAICHGAIGDGKGTFGQRLYPPAPDFRSDLSKEFTDGELFWIIKNGLSFVNMPGFGDRYDDNSIWQIVLYVRSLQQGQARAITVPEPTAEQLAFAVPTGSPEQRGASTFFAQGCSNCHGAVGNAPGDLRLNNARELQEAVRKGKPGMPKFSTEALSDGDMTNVSAYITYFVRSRPAPTAPGAPGGAPPNRPS